MTAAEHATQLADAALAHAKRVGRASHVEVRWVESERASLTVSGQRVDELSSARTSGFGVRVLAGGGWGFASTKGEREQDLVRAVDAATAIGLAAGALRRVVFPPEEARVGAYATPIAEDPFDVPLDAKLGTLLAATERLAAHPAVMATDGYMEWARVTKVLVTSEGTRTTQRFVYTGAGMSCVARADDGVVQRRTYPGFRGSELAQRGYEHVRALDLPGNAEQLREEAVLLSRAAPCPAGRTSIILDSSQLALQIHESCGHATELDRALGHEVSLAGGSFLQPGMLGSFRYGAPIVDLTCDATAEGGLGTFGWDDEGTPASKTHLVKDGVFVDYLSSRETAHALGRRSTGAMRADGWSRPPIIRMLNVSLTPGRGSLEELIADTDDGILLVTNRSWSIDDLRKDFQFGCEMAWEIKRGKRTRPLRDAVYRGDTPTFWGACDAICGPEEHRLWGISTCGKGDPVQAMHVGHGAAPARFHDVAVGAS